MPARRKCSPEFKAKLFLDVICDTKIAADVRREHNRKPDLFSKWKSTFVVNAARVFQNDDEVNPAQTCTVASASIRR